MKKSKLINNSVNHPRHYTSHPSGIEAIELCGYMVFNIGNAFKYLYRLDKKLDSLEDLKKARWYIDRELFQRGEPIPIKQVYAYNVAKWWEHEGIPEDWFNSNLIKKIVGVVPGNVEKALYYLWLADRCKENSWQLQAARSYVNSEIRKRQRTLKKDK